MPPPIPTILVHLNDIPTAGSVMIIGRLKLRDRNKLNIAAEAIGLSQADFIRAMVIGGADAILSELGITVPNP